MFSPAPSSPGRKSDPETTGDDESARPAGTTVHRERDPWAHPGYVAIQSNLGSPRIVGELQKLGICCRQIDLGEVSPTRASAILANLEGISEESRKDLVACDFFTVPTATFQVLFVFVILAHERRRIVHFNVTEHPTAQWTAQQMVEAFPWDEGPRYVLRDRDSIYGTYFQQRIEHMGIEEVKITPRSPWQNPYAERVIGSIRRECLNEVIVLNETLGKQTCKIPGGVSHACSRQGQFLTLDVRQIAKQRPATNAHCVRHFCRRSVRVEIENPSLFKLIGGGSWPSAGSSSGFCRRTARCGALRFQLPLHLSNDPHHRQETSAGCR